MSNHTVVAVYETAAQAAAAVNDLQSAHVLPDAISQHTKTLTASDTTHSPPHEQGFWASLFGGDDTSVYDRSVEEGASVLTYVFQRMALIELPPSSNCITRSTSTSALLDILLRAPQAARLRTAARLRKKTRSGWPRRAWRSASGRSAAVQPVYGATSWRHRSRSRSRCRTKR